MKRVGLLGGSFDPVHTGHIELAKAVLKDFDLDEIWFVIAYDQPFKDNHFESFDDRLRLLKIALRNNKKLKVCDVEKTLPTPSYSYNTVMALKEKHPNHEFMWIIGDDQLENFDKWYKYEAIIKEIEFIVVNRNDEVIPNTFKYLNFKSEASSTKIRNGEFKYLDYKVMQEIYKRHLYFDTILHNLLSKKRADHTLRCVEVALEIAMFYNVDKVDVFKAVVLHDIAKELDSDEEVKLMSTYFTEHLDVHHKVYHQFTGSHVAKSRFRINNQDILNAIKYHTTGDDHSILGMIVYISDKLERGRSYPTEAYIDLCKENIYKGFKAVRDEVANIKKENYIGK